MNTSNPIEIAPPVSGWIFLCREEFEEALREEIADRASVCGVKAETGNWVSSPGCLFIPASAAAPMESAGVFQEPFCFERQRLAEAVALPTGSLKPMAREVFVRLLPRIARSDAPWTLHVFGVEISPWARKADTLQRVLLEQGRDRFTAVFRRYREPRELDAAPGAQVMQLLWTDEALWGSVMPLERMTDRWPGGLHRMPFDPQSPSRSYLKMEEAFTRMGEEPESGQKVVDLGAAPGGWSWSFLKRGCSVIAVDHGPMKIPGRSAAGGQLEHIRGNGITYEPPPGWTPVDWLVSDMLQPPGVNLGMLRKWFERKWMKRFVINIKLPQEQPWTALRPLFEFIRSQRGVTAVIRQLYHDRREVTLMGRFRSE